MSRTKKGSKKLKKYYCPCCDEIKVKNNRKRKCLAPDKILNNKDLLRLMEDLSTDTIRYTKKEYKDAARKAVKL